MNNKLVTTASALIFIGFSAFSSAATVTVTKDVSTFNGNGKIDIPNWTTEKYGIEDWTYNINVEGPLYDSPINIEKSYGRLPEDDEGTFLGISSKFVDYGYSLIYQLRLDPNAEPSSATYYSDVIVQWSLDFTVDEDMRMNIMPSQYSDRGDFVNVSFTAADGSEVQAEYRNDNISADLTAGQSYQMTMFSRTRLSGSGGPESELDVAIEFRVDSGDTVTIVHQP